MEFAGNAALNASDPTSPLQNDADFDWIADSGATSHMTLLKVLHISMIRLDKIRLDKIFYLCFLDMSSSHLVLDMSTSWYLALAFHSITSLMLPPFHCLAT